MLEYKYIGFPEISSLIKEEPKIAEFKGIEKFSSEEDFKDYLQEASSASYSSSGFALGRGAEVVTMVKDQEAAPAAPERVSETNVQVAGVDEPDIVKTDGKEIYFSPEQLYYWRGTGIMMPEIYPPEIKGETKLIKAFPPQDLAQDSKIEKSGNLLLSKNILVVFSDNEIFGYNVSDVKNPSEIWKIDLEQNNYLVGARLYQDKIYLVTRAGIDTIHPCPLRPLSMGGKTLEISCLSIYHPVVNFPADVTYNAMILDFKTGEIIKSLAFVGSANNSVIYMSQEAIYITYSYYGSFIKFYSGFFREKAADIVPSWVIEKLDKLESYDISEAAKSTEFSIILEKYYSSLSQDERLKIENELANRMGDYYKVKMRELEKTGIIKIGLSDFEILASGAVPGHPLNQFSLDEYKNNLRLASTVGDSGGIWWGGFSMGSAESANDVYVLDKDLKISGAIQNLGLTERIYSARFIEDKGYLVTFRQVDPFYVLDLSDPKNPQLKGELKIPGYSSYLHPVAKDKILGIGQDSWQVKVSLFDVSSASDPKEAAKYTLDESWTDVMNNYHAFLLDGKHEIFFLPGGRGGYVFSYKGDKLELERAVSDISARRAIYLDDYLYIIGDNKIVVLNELTWERVKELEF